MIPLNFWEHQNAVKALYSKCVGTICDSHNITRMELDILLFLANNPQFNTAKDIIEKRYLSKSQVSSSIKLLEKRGFLKKSFESGNRKTLRLTICDAATSIIDDGRVAQIQFLSVMFRGFTKDEIFSMKECAQHMWNNIDNFLKEEM